MNRFKPDFYAIFSGNNMILFLILCGMVNNFFHNASLYNSIHAGEWQGFFVVLIFDIGLIVLMLNEKADEAQFLAIVLGVINLMYWDFITDCYQWQEVIQSPDRLKKVLAKLIYTVVFTFFLHRYSSLYVSKSTAIPHIRDLKAQNEDLKAKVKDLEGYLEESRELYISQKGINDSQTARIRDLESTVGQLKPYMEAFKIGDFVADISRGLDFAVKSIRAKRGASKS